MCEQYVPEIIITLMSKRIILRPPQLAVCWPCSVHVFRGLYNDDSCLEKEVGESQGLTSDRIHNN